MEKGGGLPWTVRKFQFAYIRLHVTSSNVILGWGPENAFNVFPSVALVQLWLRVRTYVLVLEGRFASAT